MQYEDIDRNTRSVSFDSVNELVRYASGGEILDAQCRAYNHSKARDTLTADGRSNWYNGFDLTKIEHFLRSTPTYLLDAINEVRDQIIDEIPIPQRKRRNRRRNQEFGDSIDVDACVTRRTDGWERLDRLPQDAKSVRVAINPAVLAHRRSNDLVYRGAVAAVVTDMLEASGCAVELSAVSITSNASEYTRRLYTTVIVKESGDPLDVCSLAYVTGEIGFYRRIFLSVRPRIVKGRVSSGLGSTAEFNLDDHKDYDIVIDSNITSLHSAVSLVKQVIDRIDK